MKLPRTTDEFRKWLQSEIAELQTFLVGEAEQVQFEDAAIAVKNARRLAVALELPTVADLCDITTSAMSVTKAQTILTRCLSSLVPKTLTVQQAADHLKVSERTLYDLVRSGRLHHTRLGNGRGTIRIAPGDLTRIGPIRRLKHL